MELIWRILFCAAIGTLVWFLHRSVGQYPQALPASEHPHRDIRMGLFLWGVALLVSLLMVSAISPYLKREVADQTPRSLIEAVLLSIPFGIVPVLLVIRPRCWTPNSLGLTWKVQSFDAALFAVIVGLASGGIAYAAGQSNIPIEPFPLGVLLFLIYSNAFLEEFYYRGLIQSLLERAAGQRRAILWGGSLFGLTHVAYDISMLAEAKGVLAVLLAILMQTLAGWLFGIIFMKPRF